MAEWEWPYGMRMPMGPYALAATRHMHQFGTTSEHLAQIAVSTREWATRNPRARYQTPLTIDDVLASPLQTSPLHLLDCCLVTDGAGAFVMTSAERAKSLRKPPVYVLGAATCHDHMMITQMPDLTTTPGAVCGPKALAMAGITPADVDLLDGLRQLHHHRPACTSRTWVSAPRARAAPSPRTASSARAARCP